MAGKVFDVEQLRPQTREAIVAYLDTTRTSPPIDDGDVSKFTVAIAAIVDELVGVDPRTVKELRLDRSIPPASGSASAGLLDGLIPGDAQQKTGEENAG